MAALARDRRGAGLAIALAVVALVVPLRASGETNAAREKGVWLAGDLHIHTCFSHDAYCPPDDDNTGPDEAYTLGRTVEEQFCDASRRDLDFLAITDHNDIRSQKDSGWGACGVLPIPGYENSLQGHAQMLGAREIYDNGDRSAHDVDNLAKQLQQDGGAFQVNHPAEGSVDWPNDPDWKYGYDVIPDTVEVWNISTLWQPPAPSGSSNDDAIRYWEGWLDRGYHVGATGGSDNHYKATSLLQGPGQPTTWVFAKEPTEAAIVEGLRKGRTTISAQPPGFGGPRLFLEGDGNGDGTYEAMVGDTVAAGAQLRARVENAPGALLRILTTNGEAFPPVPITGTSFEHRFTVPGDAAWVRAEVVQRDAQAERDAACDGQLGGETTYCRNRLALLAMTSALYLEQEVSNGSTYARFEDDRIVLGNSMVERSWTRESFGTEYMLDKRSGLRLGATDEFSLTTNAFAPSWNITGASFDVERASAAPLDGGGLALTMELAGTPGRVVRTVKVYPDVAGFELRTSLQMAGALSRYELEQLALPGATPEIHSFRAGYDWRGSDTPDWGPQVSPFGGHHSGDHRVTTRGEPGQRLDGEAEWLSLATGSGPRAFSVAERVDYASSRMRYLDGVGGPQVDLHRDLAYLGPFESDVHVGNPNLPARYRALSPSRPLELEPVFTGFGLDADDEAWQHDLYVRRRWGRWEPTVVFNSNGVDANRISTGAKDDMDLAEVQRQAEIAKRMGVETFVLDDGWQAVSGDWCPDSPQCPEPRGTHPPRFPDAEFKAVREAIEPMELGLWMSPMMFNPASRAHADNPTWTCDPVGRGLYAYNAADPGSGSNEAGIVPWNPEATGPDGKLIDYIEGRIRRAIEQWKVSYFKFDFMVWLDCAGVDTVTAYDYRESFIRMLDRLIEAHPSVTFQIDETNDYRLFPFESAYRGPSWYANGSPKTNEALHNLWILSPYVPASTLGQAAIRGGDPVTAERMASSLTSHMTFFSDLTKLSEADVAMVRRWTDLYRAERDRFTALTYPLLDDPLAGDTWTGLQPWNPETGEGALLVFRQASADETRTVPLRGILGEGSFRLTDAETGDAFGVFTADELRDGISISLPQPHSARVLLIDPAGA